MPLPKRLLTKRQENSGTNVSRSSSKFKFSPGEKVGLITGTKNTSYVYACKLYATHNSYVVWDGSNDYDEVDEWMLRKFD